MSAGLQILRVVAVVGLIVGAAVLATPKGKLPLALRGVYRIVRRDRALPDKPVDVVRPSALKRTFAFLMVLLAAALCMV